VTALNGTDTRARVEGIHACQARDFPGRKQLNGMLLFHTNGAETSCGNAVSEHSPRKCALLANVFSTKIVGFMQTSPRNPCLLVRQKAEIGSATGIIGLLSLDRIFGMTFTFARAELNI
jgi:hypothetical protein